MDVFIIASKIVTQPPKPSPVSRNIEVIALFVRALCSKIEYDSLQEGKKGIYCRKHWLNTKSPLEVNK